MSGLPPACRRTRQRSQSCWVCGECIQGGSPPCPSARLAYVNWNDRMVASSLPRMRGPASDTVPGIRTVVSRAKTVRTRALDDVSCFRRKAAWEGVIEVEPVNSLRQNDFEGVEGIGWVFGTISATGSSVQRES